MRRGRPVAFARIAAAALDRAETIVVRWIPDGRREGREWVARNPCRSDHRAGNFKINLATGKWADFASGDRGGDLISLAAYLFSLSQRDAALKVADMLGIDAHD